MSQSRVAEAMSAKAPHLRSLLLLHKGDLVLEQYWQGATAEECVPLASATKSVVSLLVGMAIRHGFVNAVDQPLSAFFPELQDSPAGQIRIWHLLSMTSGLGWPPAGQDAAGPDGIAVLRSLPLVNEPGTHFAYKPDSQVLYWLLERVAGMDVPSFADRYLFRYIGIHQRHWATALNGHQGLSLRPRDMARIGQLMLNHGMWQSGNVAPCWYVREATRRQVEGGPPEKTGYGWLWWVDETMPHPAFFASGFGGQYIYVVPDLDYVAVTTATMDGPHPETRQLIREILLPAVTL